jgi:iron complex outermembrane receptor protein
VFQNNNFTSSTDTSLAAFTQETFHFTDFLALTAGVRYSEERKAVSNFSDAFPNGGYLWGKWPSTTPKVSLEFDPTANFLAYISYTKGFKSGGVDYAIYVPADFQKYDPEWVSSYEVGEKAMFFDNRLRVNGALFYSRYTNLQFPANVAAGEYTCPESAIIGCYVTVNGADARIQGAELEVTAAVTTSFNLYLNMGHLEGKYTSIAPTLISGDIIQYGDQLPKTPRWNTSVGAEYTVAVGGGNLAARVDYAYKSLTYTEYSNNPLLAQGGFGLLGARITFTTADDHWQFAILGQNLTDKLYLTSGESLYGSLGTATGAYAPPRTVAASVRYSFGSVSREGQ